jgi:23S rRNA pseudouridine2605 synthase
MIEERRIAIDGKPVEKPATLLSSLRGVTVDGKAVKAPTGARLFRYHKPAGVLTAATDPQGRPTIYDRLPEDLPAADPVGRLDMNTEGLLLLTTDGGLKRQLELPASGVERTYRARAFGEISQEQLESLIEGIEIEGIRYGSIDANLERRTGRNSWIEMRLTEGKNREVRRVLEHFGLQVSRLIRVAYGPFLLEDLPAGGVDEVNPQELAAFAKQIGLPRLERDGDWATVAKNAPRERLPRAATARPPRAAAARPPGSDAGNEAPRPARARPARAATARRPRRDAADEAPRPPRGRSARPATARPPRRDAAGEAPRPPRAGPARSATARPPGRDAADEAARPPRARSARAATSRPPRRDAAEEAPRARTARSATVRSGSPAEGRSAPHGYQPKSPRRHETDSSPRGRQGRPSPAGARKERGDGERSDPRPDRRNAAPRSNPRLEQGSGQPSDGRATRRDAPGGRSNSRNDQRPNETSGGRPARPNSSGRPNAPGRPAGGPARGPARTPPGKGRPR